MQLSDVYLLFTWYGVSGIKGLLLLGLNERSHPDPSVPDWKNNCFVYLFPGQFLAAANNGSHMYFFDHQCHLFFLGQDEMYV